MRIEDFIPIRLWLPYGWWTLEDGCEVPFSRDYCPLWKISPTGSIERLQPSRWITGIRAESWFSARTGSEVWHSGAARKKAETFLKARSILGLPLLADVLPALVQGLGLSDAIKKIEAATGEGVAVADPV